MKKIKISLFFSLALALVLTLAFSAAWAKSENANGANVNSSMGLVNTPSPSASPSASVSPSASPSASPSPSPTSLPSLNKGQINAAEHRSVVSTFVQGLLKVADKEGGIGEQVRVIAQQQNDVEAMTTRAMEEVQTRSKIKTFFFGTDYKNLGELRSQIVQTASRIDQLSRLIEKAKSVVNKETIQAQIQVLQQEQAKLQNFIKDQEGKFSLFGWVTKLFNK